MLGPRHTPRPKLLALSAVASLAVLFGAVPSLASASAPTAPTRAVRSAAAARTAITRAHRPHGPCTGTRAPRRWDHVIWIIMENHSAQAIIGSPDARFETALARACGRAATYSAVTHPSLPNYLALTSGSTHGAQADLDPAQLPVRGPSIFTTANAARRSWMTFAEAMPSRCLRTSSGRYAVKHNPGTYYTALRRVCAGHNVPMGSTRRGNLAYALAHNRLPAFSLLIPDLCHDDHDCPVAVGDGWLRTWVDTIVSSRAYRSGRTALFITWDENDGGPGNQVALLAVAPSIRPGTVARGRLWHLSLLHTTLLMLGLRDRLTSRQTDMRRGLGL